MNQSVSLIPSATTILLHPVRSGFDVLLLQRNSKITTHGGSWVFPGGKCDTSDSATTEDLKHFEHLSKQRQIEIAK